MKPKTNRSGKTSKSATYDRCQTPFYAVDPILPYLKPEWVVWESAAGEGQIVAKLRVEGFTVLASDILTGTDFFDCSQVRWDVQITNPPYSTKYRWLERSYQLGKPFALLLPLETLGAAKGQRLFKEYGIEIILLDKRINFKMPNRGYSGSGAQFPTAWFTWGLGIGRDLTYATIQRYEDGQMNLLEATPADA